MLTKTIKKDIIAHAKEQYPRESCGLIVGKKYIPCENVAASNAQFEIKASDYVKAAKKGKVKAIVHSHPDGTTEPSVPDKVQMGLHGLPWVITDGSDCAIHKPKDYSAPLVGRQYFHGLMDCYSLVRDYYNRELGIMLNDYERSDAWWESKDSKSLYLDNFKKEGFVEVDTLQKHDLVLCRLGRTEHVNHALVFVGDGKLQSEQTDDVIGNSLVLHHPYNKVSRREIYGEQWQRRAVVMLRHKSIL